jgi:hypothetical protein
MTRLVNGPDPLSWHGIAVLSVVNATEQNLIECMIVSAIRRLFRRAESHTTKVMFKKAAEAPTEFVGHQPQNRQTDRPPRASGASRRCQQGEIHWRSIFTRAPWRNVLVARHRERALCSCGNRCLCAWVDNATLTFGRQEVIL